VVGSVLRLRELMISYLEVFLFGFVDSKSSLIKIRLR
jgi:hypothetical protein